MNNLYTKLFILILLTTFKTLYFTLMFLNSTTSFLFMIREKLKTLRILKGFTQEDMALSLNVSVNTYGKIESGSTKLVDYGRIHLLAAKLEVSFAELLGANEVQQTFYEKVEHGYIKTIHHLHSENHELISTLNTQLQLKDKEIERLMQQNEKLLSTLLKFQNP